MTVVESSPDPWRPTRAAGLDGLPPLLQAWNDAEALDAVDLHLAVRLGALGGEQDPDVLLACALASRAVREGSVCLDLADVQHPGIDEVPDLPAPEPWRDRVMGSPLVGPDRPWVWDEERLYLHRHLAEERQVAADLAAREHVVRPGDDVVPGLLDQLLDEAYGPAEPAQDAGQDAGRDADAYADQRAAVETACRHRTAVITGGPGTGKTTTLARLIAALIRRHAAESPGAPPLRIHLTAPTGKAAARMAQSVTAAAEDPGFPFPDVREQLRGLPATTVHRLLGWRPGHGSRFAHDREHHLPVDVVIVDEASMLSLTLMARLLEALRPEARLVLLGDADQLASVDAGAVMSDLVDGLEQRPEPPVARLVRSRRFGSEIGALATAVRDGDADGAVALLSKHLLDPQAADPSESPVPDGASPPALTWVRADGAPHADGGRFLERLLLAQARSLYDAAGRGVPSEALAALGASRLLCAHREGPYGAATWNRQVLRSLGASLGRHLPVWYAGRPLLVERNDPGLALSNGDAAVVIAEAADPAAPTGPEGAWPAAQVGLAGIVDDGSPSGRRLGLSRLAQTGTAYAMTVHRAQGSQFGHVVMLLPDPDSRVLSRQLLYTALTRAAEQVTVVGTEEALRAAIDRRASRATLLSRRVSGDMPGDHGPHVT